MSKAENAATTENAAAPATVAKVQQNGVTRPNAGTKTARVWEIADAKSAELKAVAPRKDVLAAAEAEGINVTTAATQYGKWCKFHGIVKAPKAEAAPAEAAPAAEAAPVGDVTVQ